MKPARWALWLVSAVTLFAAWLAPARARAHGLASLEVPSWSAPGAPMSVRPPEAPRGQAAPAPLCDSRCATTFAPAAQLQDEEVTLATDGETSALELARVVPGDREPSIATSSAEPCALPRAYVPLRAPWRAGPPPEASRPGERCGARAGVERPPRRG